MIYSIFYIIISILIFIIGIARFKYTKYIAVKQDMLYLFILSCFWIIVLPIIILDYIFEIIVEYINKGEPDDNG